MIIKKQKQQALFISMTLVLCLIITTIMVFGFRWRTETKIYECDWEWDDDHDKYDVFVPDLAKHYYVKTEKENLIYVTEDVDGICEIQTRKYLFTDWNQSTEITKFYINLYSVVIEALGY